MAPPSPPPFQPPRGADQTIGGEIPTTKRGSCMKSPQTNKCYCNWFCALGCAWQETKLQPQKKGTTQGVVPFFEAPNTYGLTKFKLMLKYNGLLN